MPNLQSVSSNIQFENEIKEIGVIDLKEVIAKINKFNETSPDLEYSFEKQLLKLIQPLKDENIAKEKKDLLISTLKSHFFFADDEIQNKIITKQKIELIETLLKPTSEAEQNLKPHQLIQQTLRQAYDDYNKLNEHNQLDRKNFFPLAYYDNLLKKDLSPLNNFWSEEIKELKDLNLENKIREGFLAISTALETRLKEDGIEKEKIEKLLTPYRESKEANNAGIFLKNVLKGSQIGQNMEGVIGHQQREKARTDVIWSMRSNIDYTAFLLKQKDTSNIIDSLEKFPGNKEFQCLSGTTGRQKIVLDNFKKQLFDKDTRHLIDAHQDFLRKYLNQCTEYTGFENQAHIFETIEHTLGLETKDPHVHSLNLRIYNELLWEIIYSYPIEMTNIISKNMEDRIALAKETIKTARKNKKDGQQNWYTSMMIILEDIIQHKDLASYILESKDGLTYDFKPDKQIDIFLEGYFSKKKIQREYQELIPKDLMSKQASNTIADFILDDDPEKEKLGLQMMLLIFQHDKKSKITRTGYSPLQMLKTAYNLGVKINQKYVTDSERKDPNCKSDPAFLYKGWFNKRIRDLENTNSDLLKIKHDSALTLANLNFLLNKHTSYLTYLQSLSKTPVEHNILTLMQINTPPYIIKEIGSYKYPSSLPQIAFLQGTDKIKENYPNNFVKINIAKYASILKEYGVDLLKKDNNDNSILHLYAEDNNQTSIRHLHNDAKPIFSQLIEQENKDGLTPLMYAAKSNKTYSFQELYKLGANIKRLNNKGENILHLDPLGRFITYAYHEFRKDFYSLLRGRNKNGDTPLTLLAKRSNDPNVFVNIGNLFGIKNINWSETNAEDNNILHIIAQNCPTGLNELYKINPKTFKDLASKKNNVQLTPFDIYMQNIENHFEANIKNAKRLVFFNNNKEMMLLAAQNINNQKPCAHTYPKIRQKIIEKKDKNGNNATLAAYINAEFEKFKLLAKLKPSSITCQNNILETVFKIAVLRGSKEDNESIEYINQSYSQEFEELINKKHNNGNTPINTAVIIGNMDSFKLLLSYKALNLLITDDLNNNILHNMIHHDREEMAKLLKEKDAPTFNKLCYTTNNKNLDPITLSFYEKNIGKIFGSHEDLTKIKDTNDRNIVHFYFQNHLSIGVIALGKAKPDMLIELMKQKDNKGQTPLELHALESNVNNEYTSNLFIEEVFNFLLNKKIIDKTQEIILRQNEEGNNICHLYILKKKSDHVKSLISICAEKKQIEILDKLTSQTNKNYQNILHMAAQEKIKHIFNDFMDKDHINHPMTTRLLTQKDNNGDTPLFIAVKNHSYSRNGCYNINDTIINIMNKLVEVRNKNLNNTNNQGKKISDVAKEANNNFILEHIENWYKELHNEGEIKDSPPPSSSSSHSSSKKRKVHKNSKGEIKDSPPPSSSSSHSNSKKRKASKKGSKKPNKKHCDGKCGQENKENAANGTPETILKGARKDKVRKRKYRKPK